MRLLIFICMILMNSVLQAQNSMAILSLPFTEKRLKTIPFYLSEVVFSQDISDTLGMINSAKKNGNTFVRLPNNRAEVVLDFLRSRFEEDKSGNAIQLEITKLSLAPTEAGTFSHKDTFQFQCKFYAISNNEKVALYSFNAKNVFGTFDNAESVMANYISRALISSIDKFKESYEKNVDWRNAGSRENGNEKKMVKVVTFLNKMASLDSIPCTGDRQLTWADFQEPAVNSKLNKNENADLGSAKLILTYKAITEETNKYLKITVFVNAFFFKRNSWKPKNHQDLAWLQYQQGHFDLCSIFGIKLYNKINSHSFSLGAYKTELNTLYNKINLEFISLRKQYQAETDEGKRADQMMVWRKKIEELRENTK